MIFPGSSMAATQYCSHGGLLSLLPPKGGKKKGKKPQENCAEDTGHHQKFTSQAIRRKQPRTNLVTPQLTYNFGALSSNTRNAGTIPIKHADCLKRAVWSLSFNKWILFVGRNDKIFFTHLIHRKKVLTTWNSSAKSYKNFK